MAEDQIEKTEGSAVVRVNMRKSTFIVIQNGAPVASPDSKGKSIVHALPNIVFLGQDFELVDMKAEDVVFFSVKGGLMQIPFRDSTMSDIRHLVVETQVEADILPAKVFQYSNYKIGMLPKSLPQPVYFLVESKVDREGVIRLKTVYPLARMAIYKHEKVTRLAVIESSANSGLESVRATDLLRQGGAAELSQNPTFVARIYLRKLEWSNMRDLPYRMILNEEDANNILTFLGVMLKNERKVQELEDNRSSIKTLEDFYRVLSVFLSYDVVKLETFFENDKMNKFYINPLKKVLAAQEKLLKSNANSDFFSMAYQKLDELNSDN